MPRIYLFIYLFIFLFIVTSFKIMEIIDTDLAKRFHTYTCIRADFKFIFVANDFYFIISEVIHVSWLLICAVIITLIIIDFIIPFIVIVVVIIIIITYSSFLFIYASIFTMID